MSFTLQRAPEPWPRDQGCFSLPPGALHEIHAATEADSVCLSGFALMLGSGGKNQSVLWIRTREQDREAGLPYPSGLVELGLMPSAAILVRPVDVVSALQAALEGARCAALGAVVVELWGRAKAYDLTASRRLALAAKASGVSVFMVRAGDEPVPSAAETRWQLRAMPSQALPAKAPGHPAFHLTLLRARNGLEGVQHHLEWDRDARQFVSRQRAISVTDHRAPHAAPLSGAVASLSVDRSGAPQSWRAAG